MRYTRMKKHSYVVMLSISFVIVCLLRLGPLQLNTHEEQAPAPTIEEPSNENEPSEEDENVSEDVPPTETPEEPSTEETPEESLQPVQRPADASYFDDALFIGDSRTMGLWEYGDLGNATVLADSGMSVYKILQENLKSADGGTYTLQTLLEENTYGKIYLMLGINELGYDFDATVKKYEELVSTIRQLQPDAILFIEANLHITKEKSDTSDIFNNDNINRFNEAVSKLADNEHIFYLDVNPLFDDERGGLSPEYTSDKVHVLGKYYLDWSKWLLEQAVFYE